MIFCRSCGKSTPVVDPYSPYTSCKHCWSTNIEKVDPSEVNPSLKRVKRYCYGCGHVIPDYDRTCSKCYETRIIEN